MTLNLNQRIIWLIALTEMINWLQTSVFFFCFWSNSDFYILAACSAFFFFSQNVFSKSQPRSSSFIWADAGATKSALTFQPNFIEKREVMAIMSGVLVSAGPARPQSPSFVFAPFFLDYPGVRWSQMMPTRWRSGARAAEPLKTMPTVCRFISWYGVYS